MEKEERKKILFIGLDGADRHYMKSWLDAGELPNLAKLMSDGVAMPLESTLIDYTSVAWPSLFTGKNPARTGATDITYRIAGTHKFAPVSLRGVQTEPFWVFLGEQGLTSLIVNVPGTYPPPPLKGAMISGFDTPQGADDYAYPDALLNQLNADGYVEKVLDAQHRLFVSGAGISRGKVDGESYLAACRDLTRHQTDTALKLMRDIDPDVAFIGYQITDFVNHLTTDMDILKGVYKLADQMVGELISEVGEDVTVILASDHGSKQCDRVISLSRVLEQADLLVFKPVIASDVIPWLASAILPGPLDNLKNHARIKTVWDWLPDIVQRALSWLPLKRYPGWAHYYGSIDWTQTKVYVVNAAKALYINRADVLPGGIVQPGEDYDTDRSEIIEKLEAIHDPDTGEKVFEVHRPEDHWQGPFLDETAPDLILTLLDERYAALQSDARGRAFWDEDPEVIGGVHRHDGLLILRGKEFKSDEVLPSADIVDVVPALLHLMGLPLPQGLDGKLPADAFDPAYLEANPLEFEPHARPEIYSPPDREYTEAEMDSVMEKLRALGYVE